MPNGLTLKDSRTFVQGDYYAFQSCHSPLSNLFPCSVKKNGIVYASSEHCFQHTKAVENRDYSKARAILAEPDPFEAMMIAKSIKTSQDWLDSRQLQVMEEIAKLKKEQVPEFATELANSTNHKLVEFSRSYYWGAGHTTSVKQIFHGSFKGLNHFGRILEKVRSDF